MVDAVKLHGHLGPFLVVGVRMGSIAKKVFNPDAGDSVRFQVTAKVPLVIPFSCTINGIQAATRCTIGKQRLRTENTHRQIFASFRDENSDYVVRISVKPRVIRDLMRKMVAGIRNDELAAEIVAIPERQLFKIEKEYALPAV
jgi:formylmethanofuran dehydrogenase subunit E